MVTSFPGPYRHPTSRRLSPARARGRGRRSCGQGVIEDRGRGGGCGDCSEADAIPGGYGRPGSPAPLFGHRRGLLNHGLLHRGIIDLTGELSGRAGDWIDCS